MSTLTVSQLRESWKGPPRLIIEELRVFQDEGLFTVSVTGNSNNDELSAKAKVWDTNFSNILDSRLPFFIFDSVFRWQTLQFLKVLQNFVP